MGLSIYKYLFVKIYYKCVILVVTKQPIVKVMMLGFELEKIVKLISNTWWKSLSYFVTF